MRSSSRQCRVHYATHASAAKLSHQLFGSFTSQRRETGCYHQAFGHHWCVCDWVRCEWERGRERVCVCGIVQWANWPIIVVPWKWCSLVWVKVSQFSTDRAAQQQEQEQQLQQCQQSSTIQSMKEVATQQDIESFIAMPYYTLCKCMIIIILDAAPIHWRTSLILTKCPR